MYVNLALQDSTPCLVNFLFVLFFGRFGVRRRFFSLSGAGEIQAFKWFVFSLVFLGPPHALRLQPVLQGPHLRPGVAPAAVFLDDALLVLFASFCVVFAYCVEVCCR